MRSGGREYRHGFIARNEFYFNFSFLPQIFAPEGELRRRFLARFLGILIFHHINQRRQRVGGLSPKSIGIIVLPHFLQEQILHLTQFFCIAGIICQISLRRRGCVAS